MQHADRLAHVVKDYFLDRGWRQLQCAQCGVVYLRKSASPQHCPMCTVTSVYHQNTQNLDGSNRAPQLHQAIAQRLSAYYENAGGAQLAHSLPIWKTLRQQVFVGSGFEYIYPHRYGGKPLPKLPVLLLQPSIRLRGGIIEMQDFYQDPEQYYGLAFVNGSALFHLKGQQDFAQTLDTAISAFSAIGIHATRICLTFDQNPYIDDISFKVVVRIFVDDFMVGDHIAIVSTTGQQSVIETGFGLERLATRVARCPYAAIIKARFEEEDLLLLKSVHFLALFMMSCVPFRYEQAWSKAKTIGHLLSSRLGNFDSYLLFRHMYNWWKPFVTNPADPISAYAQFLDILGAQP